LVVPFAAWFFEAAEVGTPGFNILVVALVIANAAIYSLVGAAYAGLKGKPSGN
jgi:hypothetical protein